MSQEDTVIIGMNMSQERASIPILITSPVRTPKNKSRFNFGNYASSGLVPHKERTTGSQPDLGILNSWSSPSLPRVASLRQLTVLPFSRSSLKLPKREYKESAQQSTDKTSLISPPKISESTYQFKPERDWFFCIPVLRKQVDSTYAKVGVTLLHCRGYSPIRQINIATGKPVECIVAQSDEDLQHMVSFGVHELAAYRQLTMSPGNFEKVWEAYYLGGGRDIPLASLFKKSTEKENDTHTSMPRSRMGSENSFENINRQQEYDIESNTSPEDNDAVAIEIESIGHEDRQQAGDGNWSQPPSLRSTRSKASQQREKMEENSFNPGATTISPMKAWKQLDKDLRLALERTFDKQFAHHLHSRLEMPPGRLSPEASNKHGTPPSVVDIPG